MALTYVRLTENNGSWTQYIHRDKHPKSLLVHATTSIIHAWICEKDSFDRNGHAAGRPTTARTPALKEAILHEIEQHPEISTPTSTTNLHCSHNSVWVILKEDKCYIIISYRAYKHCCHEIFY